LGQEAEEYNGMRLPKADAVIIAKEKITDYLLNPLHPDGAPKTVFFAAHGFTVENWQVLAEAFRQLAANSEEAQQVISRHGEKYIVDGPLGTPEGRAPIVRTVWIIDEGGDVPRLVTAYPHGEGD
jgi:hypothetical protein